jgi:hypothetical protein
MWGTVENPSRSCWGRRGSDLISKSAERADKLSGPSLERLGVARGAKLDVGNALVKDLPSE